MPPACRGHYIWFRHNSTPKCGLCWNPEWWELASGLVVNWIYKNWSSMSMRICHKIWRCPFTYSSTSTKLGNLSRSHRRKGFWPHSIPHILPEYAPSKNVWYEKQIKTLDSFLLCYSKEYMGARFSKTGRQSTNNRSIPLPNKRMVDNYPQKDFSRESTSSSLFSVSNGGETASHWHLIPDLVHFD